MALILATAYLGNIHYYTKLLCGEAIIDLHEHYQKQSYRNRCDILTANGLASLIVPVLQPHGTKSVVKELRIDPSKRWQHQHWQALISAYRNSPYLFHYEDQLAPFYEKRYDFLIDLNNDLQELMLQLLHVAARPTYTPHYLFSADHPHPFIDLRDALSPKSRLQRPDPMFDPEPYYQVFAERYAFLPNLSIIDLLCCEGPHAAALIRSSIRAIPLAATPADQS